MIDKRHCNRNVNKWFHESFKKFKIIQRLYTSRSISNHISLRAKQIKKSRCTITYMNVGEG